MMWTFDIGDNVSTIRCFFRRIREYLYVSPKVLFIMCVRLYNVSWDFEISKKCIGLDLQEVRAYQWVVALAVESLLGPLSRLLS